MLLNCHTYYSLRYGTMSVEELLQEIKSRGYQSFVISDINNTSAFIDTMRLAPLQGLKPVPGIDFRNGVEQKYVGIACNNEGFKELNEHLSKHLHADEPFGDKAPAFNHAYIVYPFASYGGWVLAENEFIGISIKDLQRLPFQHKGLNEKKLVALHTVSFTGKRSFNSHRLLRAIDANTLLSKLSPTQQGSADACLLSKEELNLAYREYPVLIRNTEQLINRCHVHMEFGKFANKNLKHYTHSTQGDMELLRTEALNGLAYRYGSPSDEVMQRVEKELHIIGQMDFASYFLINMDIVRYAQRNNYYYVGRGSGANSMIAYLLRITDVDPIELDLYFERFINPFRSTPPDFDIDFSWTDRDDITRYIFDRFGKGGRAALLGAYNTFQFDAVVRELGKVFGLPPHEIDRLQQLKNPADADEFGRLVLNYSKWIQGFPSHLSIHASGILISEEPVTSYSATFMPPKGYPTTQFSMIEAEDIGLYKFDILSQRGLGKIKDSLEIIKQNRQVDIDIHQVKKFTEDAQVKDLLRTGKSIGCFYVESPAMRMLLSKLQADDYLRLVAASSIIRPGVAKSGMMNAYIERYRNEHAREKARNEIPEMYEILQETYGVMVYQEDVIKVAHKLADLTLAESDYLRRGMSWKFKQRNEFWRVRETFFTNCRNKGYEEKTINNIWNQIESFANFAFSKAHSASYAIESFQALFLKAYYPLEYMVATLNNGGGFYRKELYVHEARMQGAVIEAPCINTSGILTTIKGNRIYLGLHLIAELEESVMEQIVHERARNGLFKDVFDVMKRLPISHEQLRLLIRINALRFTGVSRKHLLWDIYSVTDMPTPQTISAPLFDEEHKVFTLPSLTENEIDLVYDEIELLGFPVSQSPFDLLKEKPEEWLLASQLKQLISKEVTITGYRVATKNTRTAKGEQMYFGTFVDVKGEWIDTVHFPQSAASYPFQGPGCYRIRGIVKEEYDFLYIEVHLMERLHNIDREQAHPVSTRLKEVPL